MSVLPPVLQAVQEAGYKVFTRGDWNLNIVGIRSQERVANAFDDRIVVSYKNNEMWVSETFEATCDPGSPYLLKPINSYGCAVLCPGQYSSYAIGLHRGQYRALVQSRGPVKVFRDNNRDNIIDMDPDTTQSGYFGINIHKRTGESDTVNGASAGCQVFRYEREFKRFMWLCDQQVSERGFTGFTYTLLEE